MTDTDLWIPDNAVIWLELLDGVTKVLGWTSMRRGGPWPITVRGTIRAIHPETTP